jgi:UDP:flavonoid glycosyltransferase YjiC (YdhE family)
VLVIVTTGGSKTGELRSRYPEANFLIEDYIPFNDIMPVCDAYVTNGGYGGVMLGIENKLPMVVAGVHEGKNEITARVGYFGLGVNLGTEKPKAAQIREGVEAIFKKNHYKRNVTRLAAEFKQYDPMKLAVKYISALFPKAEKTKVTFLKMMEKYQEEKVY